MLIKYEKIKNIISAPAYLHEVTSNFADALIITIWITNDLTLSSPDLSIDLTLSSQSLSTFLTD